ncbi:MAG: hypothetical protein AB7P52_18565 [Alphaproteobacteria bacterium]
MTIDPREFMGTRERAVYNVSMRTHPDGANAPPNGNLVREESDFFGEDGFSFDDFLDIINPLHHLPLISIVYRELTGDQISAGARVIGGGLFGGPAGAMVGAVEAAIAGATGGKDLAVVAWNAITGEGEEPAAQVAAADGVKPAAGEIEVAAAPAPWIDPDSQPLPAPAVQPAAAPAAPAIAPAGPPAAADDAIPELSQDQVALLLSSVGLQPSDEPAAPGTEEIAEASPASLIEPAAAPAPQRMAASGRDADSVRSGLGPMKQTYVRAPANDYFIKHAPVTQEMRTHMSVRSAPLNEADQAWVAEAMAAALDKYRNGKALNEARDGKGTAIDAAH